MSKIKIFVTGSDNTGWSIDSDRSNTIRLISGSDDFEVVGNPFVADIIYFVLYETLRKKWVQFLLSFFRRFSKKKVVAVITNNVVETPDKISNMEDLVDLWISPNSKISRFLEETSRTYFQFPFLVNHQTFKKLKVSRAELVEKLGIDGLDEGKFLIGSFQRDSLGSNITKPKWQKNPDLLIKLLKELPREKYVLILAGPRRHYIINKCREYRIPYSYVGDEQYIDAGADDLNFNILDQDRINLLYNLVDLYIVSSKSEGGPKAILESALTKTLVFSTDVGLASDVLKTNYLYSEDSIRSISEKIIDIMGGQKSYEDDLSGYEMRVKKMMEGDTLCEVLVGVHEG